MKPLTVPAELLQDLEHFSQLFKHLHDLQAQGYTGLTILHWGQGWPNTIEIPAAPRLIKLERRKRQ